MHKILLFVLGCGIAITFDTTVCAQTAGLRAIQEIVREKLKMPIVRLRDSSAQATPQPGNHRKRIEKSRLTDASEYMISGNQLPESEIHAVINPVNPANIIVSAMRLDIENPYAVLICPVWFSTDNGITWTESAFRSLPGEPEAIVGGGGDPVLAADADGMIYMSWLNLYLVDYFSLYMSIFWAQSSDGGKTWTRQSNDKIASADLATAMEAFDKEWLAVDRSQSAWQGTLYAAMFNPSMEELKIVVRKKPPHATAFSPVSARVSAPSFKWVQFASIGIDDQGGVHVTFCGTKDSSTWSLYHALSVDGGMSFGEETKITDIHMPRFASDEFSGGIAGIDTGRIYPCPHLVIDASATPTRGNMYMVWSGNGVSRNEGNGMDVFVCRSTDNGASWSVPSLVNDDQRGLVRDQFHPSIAVNEDGVIAVTWYDRREDPGNMYARYYLSLSFDAGRTFTKNVPVSASPMDFSRAGLRNENFTIGEYTQVLMTKDNVMPVWSDGRTNDGNIDVMIASLPVSPSTAVERISSVATEFRLRGAFPNPVSSIAHVSFDLDAPSFVRLTLSDEAGRVVQTLLDVSMMAGSYNIPFNASDLPSGRYFCRLETAFGHSAASVLITR